MENDLQYIKDLTDVELKEFVREFADKPETLKKQFKYNAHVEELINRSTSGIVLTRATLLKALNNTDLSFDLIPEHLYVIDAEELLKELGL